MADEEQDVPYADDWHSVTGAAAWADASDRKRPWRARFRDRIAEEIAALPARARVLELGSGPGFLAERVLDHCTSLAGYTLLDFSEPMLALSRTRLARFPAASFVRADFRSEAWRAAVEAPFDAVVSMQAVHEIRHKRHVPRLYRELYAVTAAAGLVLICDHAPLDDTPRSAALYMTPQDQVAALSDAGFCEVRVLLSVGKLVLYAARRAD